MKYFNLIFMLLLLNSCDGSSLGQAVVVTAVGSIGDEAAKKSFVTLDQQHIYYFCRHEIEQEKLQKKFCMPAFHCYEKREDYCIEQATKACHPEARLDERVVETCNYWRTKYNLFPNYKPPTQEELDKYNLFK